MRKKHLTFFGADFAYLCVFGILCSFAGWIAENAVRFLMLGIIDSRFHVLPFIPVYGLIPFAIQLLIGNPNDLTPFGKRLFPRKNFGTALLSNLLSVILICAAVFLGELMIGNAWEYFFDVRLWDYSTQPFHVTRYAGLYPMLGAGLGAYLLMQSVFLPLLRFLEKHGNHKIAVAFSAVVIPLLLLDGVNFLLHIILAQTAPVYWTIS